MILEYMLRYADSKDFLEINSALPLRKASLVMFIAICVQVYLPKVVLHIFFLPLSIGDNSKERYLNLEST